MIKQSLSQFAFLKSIISIFVAGLPFLIVFYIINSTEFRLHLLKNNLTAIQISIILWYFIFLILAITFICFTKGFWKKFISILLIIFSVIAFIIATLGLFFVTSQLGSNYTYVKDCGKYDLLKNNQPGSNYGKFTLFYNDKYIVQSEFIANQESEFISNDEEQALNKFDPNNGGLKYTQKKFLECIKNTEF
jgi:glucan phosphoethanolaminetransferase (alkaline phosphatase superfamily)